MPRPARNTKPVQPKKDRPTVVDQRLQRRSMVGDSPIPIRTVIYIEVGDMPIADVRTAVAQVSKLYAVNRHPTFVCPVRNGKLTTDVLFEEEVLVFVKSVCEIKAVEGGNEIVLKGGVQAVDVARVNA